MRAMSSLERIVERARGSGRTIVLPEATDPRVLTAAERLRRDGIAAPLLMGRREEVLAAAHRHGIGLAGIAIREPAESGADARAPRLLRRALTRRSVPAEEIERLREDSLWMAAALVATGEADGVVAGATHTTAETLRAYLRVIGPGDGVKRVSSFFLMQLREPTPGGEPLLAFADSGLVPCPDVDELAEIAVRTAESFRRLTGGQPRVALLSFSTAGSARHQAVDRVVAARERLRELGPDFEFDGELQADAAIVPEVARRKAAESPIAGRANVLIFPSLDAGNIAYKLVERLAGARAIGPLLQGLGRPANDLSRGCDAEDIVLAAAVTALQAG